KLQQRESWYRVLAQNLPLTSVFLFDSDYRYLVVEGPDPAYPPEMMEGKTVQEVFPPEAVPLILPGYEAALRGERKVIERIKNGRIFEGQFAPIADEDGNIPNGLLVVRDVTAERTAADKLRESEEKFRQLIDAAPIATVVTDQTGHISIINQQAE